MEFPFGPGVGVSVHQPPLASAGKPDAARPRNGRGERFAVRRFAVPGMEDGQIGCAEVAKPTGAGVPVVVVVLAARRGDDHDGGFRPSRQTDEALQDRFVAERSPYDDQRPVLGSLLGGNGAR